MKALGRHDHVHTVIVKTTQRFPGRARDFAIALGEDPDLADMLLKVSDRSRSSMERLTQSIEKQAAAYGKTGIERMIA